MSAGNSTWRWLSFARARPPGLRSPAGLGARPFVAARPYGMDHQVIGDSRTPRVECIKNLLSGISSGPSPIDMVVDKVPAETPLHHLLKDERQDSEPVCRTQPSVRHLCRTIQPSLHSSSPDFPFITERLIDYVSASYTYTTTSCKSRRRQKVEGHRRNDLLRRMFAILCSNDGAIWGQRLADYLMQSGIPTTPGVAVAFLRSQLSALSNSSNLPDKTALIPSHLPRITHLINTSLSLPTRVSPQLFSLILQTHIRTGTPTSEVERIIKACMTAEGYDSIAKWTPEAFDLMIKACGRDGDKKSVWAWYTAFRDSDIIRSKREGKMTSTAEMVTVSWPYKSILEVFAINSETGFYTITSDAPRLILSHMREDQISPSIELVNRILAECASTRSVKTGLELWSSIRSSWRSGVEKEEEGRAIPDLDFWRLGFKLLGLPEGESQAGRISIRSVVKDLTAVEEIRKARFMVLGNDKEDKIRKCFTECLRTAPRTTYQDFPLCLYILGMMRSSHIEIGPETIDVVLRGILDHALIRRRSVDWIRHVCGDEQVDIRRARQIKLMAAGGHIRNSAVKRVKVHLGKKLLFGKERKVIDWEVLGRRVRDVERDFADAIGAERLLLKDIQLPLMSPGATLERRTDSHRTQWSSTSSSFHDAASERSRETMARLVEVVERLVEKCVVAQVRETIKTEGNVDVEKKRMTDGEILSEEMQRVREDVSLWSR